ncbi:MAG: hypothetical protein KGJ57_00080 [Sphingomonadales bacterium]|nr:hypothetical protein [Sphingomonadales bacterium]MDE2167805.1 hypothetical protein [Sphingomonadales bacterium]
MKESKEWVRQPMVDKAADEIVATRGCAVTEVKPYQVAKHLGCEPNISLYAKVRDWRRRRLDEAGTADIEVSPAVEAGFRAILDRQNAEATDHFMQTVRQVGGDLNRAAMLRVANAERRCDEAETETAEVLELCQKAEEELADANVKITALAQALADAQRREDHLRGRLEQCQMDAEAMGAAKPEEAPVEAQSSDEKSTADTPAQQMLGLSDPESDRQ